MTQPVTAPAYFEVCARCDGPMVVTRDAIGRTRVRCPRCDGVSRINPHPDDALLPQGLVRVQRLPVVAPGQLRCQRCAHGVEGRKRFCAPCCRILMSRGGRPPKEPRVERGTREHPRWKAKACNRCGATFHPRGPAARYCEAHR